MDKNRDGDYSAAYGFLPKISFISRLYVCYACLLLNEVIGEHGRGRKVEELNEEMNMENIWWILQILWIV